MAPLVEVWPASELPDRVQVVRSGFKDKRRKDPIDLEKCKLMEMVQYSCNPPTEPPPGPGVVHCKPIVRLFRRCAQGVTVETTAWEGLRGDTTTKEKGTG
ncbi:hypothetical protein FQN54_002675 [Arachnomyces sp. PD_36]|nr:hypothetical protein FQN54_002675 [Arachnomyces sp. PD_36]